VTASPKRSSLREQVARVLEREGQTVFLQWVRAIMALGVVGTAIWTEIQGGELSDPFIMLIGFVASTYFEKGSMVVSPPGHVKESGDSFARQPDM